MFYVGLAVPSAIAFMGVLIGFSLNNKRLDDSRADVNNLRVEMRDRFAQINARINLVLEEQKKVAALLAVHEYRLTQLEPQPTAQGR